MTFLVVCFALLAVILVVVDVGMETPSATLYPTGEANIEPRDCWQKGKRYRNPASAQKNRACTSERSG